MLIEFVTPPILMFADGMKPPIRNPLRSWNGVLNPRMFTALLRKLPTPARAEGERSAETASLAPAPVPAFASVAKIPDEYSIADLKSVAPWSASCCAVITSRVIGRSRISIARRVPEVEFVAR